MPGSILVLSLLLVAVASQEDCPNAVLDCPDVCANKQCARYLNAECQVDPCNGECTPTFFWRGRDVTARCPVRRCMDRVCPGKRFCVEEVRPPSCPGGLPRSLCRQFINSRCVLPTTCEELACPPGTICAANARGSLQCVTSIAVSCADLKCPEGTVCVSQGIPSRNLSVAQCLDEEEANNLPTEDTFFCDSGATICTDPVNQVCIDIYDSGRFFFGSCLEIGCDLETNVPCPDSRVCDVIPNRPFSTACISTTTVVDTNCTDEPGRCPGGLVCRETVFEDELLFSTCGVPAPTFTGPSCEELECPLPVVCNDLESIEGRGLARCAGPEFTNDHQEAIEYLLDMIDSSDN